MPVGKTGQRQICGNAVLYYGWFLQMSSTPDESPEQLPDFAEAWMRQRTVSAERLSAMRRQELCEMTEAESAAVFAKLEPCRPYPLRPTSGLVEQQRLFRLFAQSGNSAVDGQKHERDS